MLRTMRLGRRERGRFGGLMAGLAAIVWSSVACAPLGRAPATPAWDGSADQSLRIPGGSTCLGWLTRLGIDHRPLSPRPGVATPVEVHGPIGGVSYVSGGRTGVVADCRLILALDWISPDLRALGVRTIRHSGAYVYRTTRSGRPSLHARGLAIDIHGFRTPAAGYEVETDYERGELGCEQGAPLPNQVHCRLRQRRLFRELITPDHNADHHDHLHLAIAPLG